ncbi:hypothetical protein B0181_04670 [Moraxella caviae]|uniref:Uncharacterized protein n=1 Tax=Moraxella caviae TaxID=34060 RepID=A0A1T0A4B8_9GAMM|nr:hypothetical protein [Moraxella caviae]OOR90577.1 hypothetical protein B0181_04670 [Moraxella caviae]STZ13513.1 Uncharacterised protein [Moraxella caviae]STZ13617.1 Uncharacterised protein [Moraxella caviae]STZ13719.1 Uncharacterised protein [Moraxella caviae]VEW13301.1 Uncharacterised protein [Moraxella caviae]
MSTTITPKTIAEQINQIGKHAIFDVLKELGFFASIVLERSDIIIELSEHFDIGYLDDEQELGELLTGYVGTLDDFLNECESYLSNKHLKYDGTGIVDPDTFSLVIADFIADYESEHNTTISVKAQSIKE